jgi:hypothetical protein
MYLETVSFSQNITRMQPRKLTLIGRTQDNTEADFSSVTNTRILISHATTRDTASVIQTLVDVMTHNGGWLVWELSESDIEALPLGTFPVEILVSEDDALFIVAAQGVINVLPNIDSP